MGRTDGLHRRRSSSSTNSNSSRKACNGMDLIHQAKGKLSRPKKTTTNGVRKAISTKTTKVLRNTQLFCGFSYRDSLLSLQPETIHAASSAAESSTHTCVPRNFDLLEKPRRRSDSPHSLRELLHSPDSHHARNRHGAARVLRVSNPDLRAAAPNISSEEVEGSYRLTLPSFPVLILSLQISYRLPPKIRRTLPMTRSSQSSPPGIRATVTTMRTTIARTLQRNSRPAA